MKHIKIQPTSFLVERLGTRWSVRIPITVGKEALEYAGTRLTWCMESMEYVGRDGITYILFTSSEHKDGGLSEVWNVLEHICLKEDG